jgi:outer membrane protein OmpA-like peptidoglycan-associated protein
MKRLFFLPSLLILLLATSCTTYHFGVKDRASQVPDEFGQTEIAIAQAEQSPGAKYCPEKITKARDLGRQAADAYWACNNDEASRLLAEARRLAKEAEGCGPPPQRVAEPAPQPLPPAPIPEKICMTLNVEFDFDKSDVKTKYHDVIGKVSEFMKENPSTTTVIEGHTDNRGKYEYNIKLSERRAESVRSYLVEKFGIESSRLSTKGYGYTKPVATNETAEGRQRNRRIDAMLECVK